MKSCMEDHRNPIVEWDFRNAINHCDNYNYPGCPYAVDRWCAPLKPEIIRRWREWKRMRDEWAEFLRTQSLPERRIAFNGT